MMEIYWLKDESHKYLVGNEITLADLSAACELASLLPIKEDILKDFPKLKQWLLMMLEIPEMQELHKNIMEVQKKAYARIDSARENAAKL